MENLCNNLKNNGLTLDSAKDIRLGARPTPIGSSGAFENWGGTLKPPSQQKGGAYGDSKATSQNRNYGAAGTGHSKFKPSMPGRGRSRPPSPQSKPKGYSSQKPARSRSNSVAPARSMSSQGKRPQSSQVIAVSSGEDDSSDELDLLSNSHYSEDDPSTSQKPVNKRSKFKPSGSGFTSQPAEREASKAKAAQESTEGFVDSTGKQHNYNPKYTPTKEKTLAKLKFKKVKDGSHDFSNNPPPSSSLPSSSIPTPTPVDDGPGQPLIVSPYPSALGSPMNSQDGFFKENIASHTSNWPDICIPDTKKDKAMEVDSNSKASEKDAFSHVSPLGTKCVKSNRGSPPPSRSRIPLPTRMSSTSSENVASQDTPVAVVKEKPKPRPRARNQNAVDYSGVQSKKDRDGPSSSQLAGTSSLTKILDNASSGPDVGISRARSHSVECSSPRKTKLDEYPAMSPLSPLPSSGTPDPFAALSPLGSKEPPKQTTIKAMKPRPSSSRLPQPSKFPMDLTPTKSKDQEDEPKTMTRGRSSKEKAQSTLKGKGKAREVSDEDSDEDNDDERDVDYEDYRAKNKKKGKANAKTRAAKPKAFPMSTQVLASIGTRDIPSSSPLSSPRHGKRNSEGGSGDERASKRSKKERDVFQESPSKYAFEDEGDSLLLSSADPSTLCPYCDLPLPSDPSPLLLKLLASTKKKSHRDPRPYNPLGLKAPLTTFISVCQRHRFESQILPEAEKKGWPKAIEWKALAGRVMKMHDILKALIEDPGDESLNAEKPVDEWEVGFKRNKDKGKEKRPFKGPKARSRFWVELMDEVKKKGMRAVSGVRGQFANFEKAQPGYYGEQGSVIIHQTLYNMFPLESIDPTLTAPLTANEFLERILVPEVALRLIMEDKGLDSDLEEDIDEALEILRDSSSYGVAMFPEDGGEWGGNRKKKKGSVGDEDQLGVGDLIVMERARKRRKELEEEDEREMEVLRQREEKKRREAERKEKEKNTKSTPRDNAIEQMETADPSSAERPKPRPRPRPRTVAKDSSAMSIVDTRTDAEDEPLPTRGRDKTRSRSRSVATVSDNGRRPSSEERRRSPSASESRVFEDNELRRTPDVGWESDASNRAVVNGSVDINDTTRKARSRASSRAKSRSRSTSVRPRSTWEKSRDSKMDVEEDRVGGAVSDEDDEVEVSELITAKTPVQTEKRRAVVDVDDEPTPKAPPAHAPRPAAPVAPLLAARQRALQRKGSSASNSSTGERKHAGPPQLGMTRRATNVSTTTFGRERERSTHRTATNVDEGSAKKDSMGSDPGFRWLLDDTSQS